MKIFDEHGVQVGELEIPKPVEQDGKWWEAGMLGTPNSGDYYLTSSGHLVQVSLVEKNPPTLIRWVMRPIPHAAPPTWDGPVLAPEVELFEHCADYGKNGTTCYHCENDNCKYAGMLPKSNLPGEINSDVPDKDGYIYFNDGRPAMAGDEFELTSAERWWKTHHEAGENTDQSIHYRRKVQPAAPKTAPDELRTVLKDAFPIVDNALNYFYPLRAEDGDKAMDARKNLFILRDKLSRIAKSLAGKEKYESQSAK